MNESDVLADVVAKLDAIGIPYMVAGSFASSLHGVPRTTNDIDFVLDPSRAALDRLMASFDADVYYADAEVARDALERRSKFNIIHLASGWKIDFIICKARRFSLSELSRREHALMAGIEVFVATPEDTVLAKLEWAKLGESERQLRDVRGIVEAQGNHLDRAYVEAWLDELGLRELWQTIVTT
ncbi:hypothetical protein BH09MYX1_BH09MYX1_09570 [soil metagenome]